VGNGSIYKEAATLPGRGPANFVADCGIGSRSLLWNKIVLSRSETIRDKNIESLTTLQLWRDSRGWSPTPNDLKRPLQDYPLIRSILQPAW